MELLLGAGRRHAKQLIPPGRPPYFTQLTTLDINPDHNPDVVWDMTARPWPFEDNTFDEVHAMEVLEHLGSLGCYRSFFADFSEIWRVLKPDGYLCGTSPDSASRWVFGDPGHTRVISPESMTYLDQAEYTKQVGVTPLTDYRFVYKADFRPVLIDVLENRQFTYIMQAVKPSRISI